MNRSRTRALLPLLFIVAVAAIGVITTLVSGTKPLLGLDLQGGASVVLQPDKKVEPEVLDRTIGIIRSRVDGLGVSEPEIARQGDSIVISLPGVDNPRQALDLVGRTAELRFRPVISDLPSEVEAKAQALANKNSTTTTAKPGATTSAPAGAATTAPGASSASTTPGATAPGATAPGATATSSSVSPTTATTAASTAATAAATVATTPESAPALGAGQFSVAVPDTAVASTSAATASSAVTTAAPPTTNPPGTSSVAATTNPAASATTVVGSPSTIPGTPALATATVPPSIPQQITFDADGNIATTPIDKDDKDAQVVLPLDERSPTAPRLLLGPSPLSGAVVSSAQAETDPSSGSWQVLVDLNGRGTSGFNQLAQENCGRRVAIVLDGVVQSAPVINQPCTFADGRVQITGNFSEREARDLATVLKFGSLPVQLKPQTVQNVSASLGKDSLRAGLLTGLIGLALVALYMLVYYRTLGFVVIAGLCVSFALMWSFVALLSETRGLALSLSGAVGIIVSVGVTVDSYVVYFERLRDEIRAGRPIASAVDKGFRSAWRTILAADLTSFIGALVLYVLTVGSVRGFAFFLMISTALDVIVAYFFTRPLVAWIASRKGFTGRSLGLDPSTITTRAVAASSSTILRPSGAGATGGPQ